MPRQTAAETALQQIEQRAVEKATQLKIPDKVSRRILAEPQRILDASKSSVESVLLTMSLSREFRKVQSNSDPRGRLAGSEVDMLRAAIVFAGAGVDATLKRLIETALPELIKCSEQAREKFRKFVEEHIGGVTGVLEQRNLANALIAPTSPRDALILRYADSLTGNSLQSAPQVAATCGALGIADSHLRRRTTPGSVLDTMFRARNEIVHEFDSEEGGRKKSRTIRGTTEWATEALSVAQEIINGVANQLPQDDN